MVALLLLFLRNGAFSYLPAEQFFTECLSPLFGFVLVFNCCSCYSSCRQIPNGLPLIYDIKSKCVKLLDDGTGRDPLEVYNFGTAAKYLFRPCQNEDGSPDEECDIKYVSGASIPNTDEDQEALDYIKNAMGR